MFYNYFHDSQNANKSADNNVHSSISVDSEAVEMHEIRKQQTITNENKDVQFVHKVNITVNNTHTHTTILRRFVRVYLGEPVPEEIQSITQIQIKIY